MGRWGDTCFSPIPSSPPLPLPFLFPQRAAAEEPQHAGDRQHSDGPTRADEVQDAGRILAAGRVVVKAVEQDHVGRRSDLFGRGFHESEPQIAGGKLNAVEVAGYPALGRENHDAAGVDILVLPGIVDVAKADGEGQLLDRVGLSGEKVPALGRAGRPQSAT